MYIEEGQPPLLFYKTGIVCSEPLGFYRTVAEEYDLDVISTDQQRLEFCAAEGIRPAFTRTETNRARDLAFDLLTEKLQEGTSVLFDSHFNSYQNRERVRDTARALGAKPVLLVMHNKRDIIKANMQERYDNDELDIPKEFVDLDHLGWIAAMTSKSIEWPVDSERPVHLFGTEPVYDSIEEIDRYLVSIGY